MSELIKRVERFFKNAHVGQKRWGGEDYFDTHLIGVRDIAMVRLLELYPDSDEVAKITLNIVALGHDCPEDVEEYKNKENELVNDLYFLDIEEELYNFSWSSILAALKALNKNNHDNYLDFVLAAKRTNLYSRIVKWSDITHNLSDLHDKKGNGIMRDKYLLAKYILEN